MPAQSTTAKIADGEVEAGARQTHRGRATGTARLTWLWFLNWAFVAFNSIRLLTYMPTMWAIYVSGDSSQHSIFTWMTWAASNATTAAWLYQNGDGRANKVVVTSCGNAAMCVATCVLVLVYR